MKPLSDEESWALFRNRSFQGNPCPPNLEDVSASILKKCDSLPLAIVAISGVLALKEKDRKDEWEIILHSLVAEIEGGGKLGKMKRILLLSYNDLPYYLKTCLLYTSIYPEDYLIYVDDLIDKWIAQGLVEEEEGKSSTDIAAGYVHQLINRSLIQVAGTLPDGSLQFCRVHDVMREIIVSKSREKNFTAIANGYLNGQRCSKARHLAVHGFSDDPQPEELELDYCFMSLRSLVFFGDISLLTDPMLSDILAGCAKLLKVLDLLGAPLEDIPEEVFELFHLKYLCLGCTQVCLIPSSIGKLKNLEFLDLSRTEVTELPVEILKLRKLRSLWVNHFGNYSKNFAIIGFKSPNGIGKLLSLENLQAIEADNSKILREIGKLTKLMKLSVTKLRREDGEEFLSALVRLTNLRSLSVSSIKEDEILDVQYPITSTPRFLKLLVLDGRLERVPQWVISLQGLTLLCLRHSTLKEGDANGGIGSLQNLPNLVSLNLDRAYEGETLCFRTGGFRKLKKLEISRLTSLKCVRMEEDSMPSLQTLGMVGCKLVEELPLGIENLSKLGTLQLLDMSNVLIQKVQNLDKQSEEYQRIAHIPEVIVGHLINSEWNTSFL